MEAKRIEISTLLRGGVKKTETSMRLKYSRMTVRLVEQFLKASESGKDSSSIRKTSGYY